MGGDGGGSMKTRVLEGCRQANPSRTRTRTAGVREGESCGGVPLPDSHHPSEAAQSCANASWGSTVNRMREVRQRLDRRLDLVLAELHPDLRARVIAAMSTLGGRLTPWEGYRDAIGQAKARASGFSNADFGSSPHNYTPALACDLVLDPDRVAVRANKEDPELPDLWDDESPEAVKAWEDLEAACQAHGLERVNIKNRKTGKYERDRPHVQLPGWRSYVSAASVRGST